MEIKGYYFNRQELAGALGDLGTFLPLAIALITLNGINASSVFLAAGLLYVGAGLYYHIPMPVQPLKATAVIAISLAASPQEVAATAIGMGVICLLLCCFDLNEILRRLFPRPIIRGIQLSLGLILAGQGLNLFLDRRFLSSGPEVTVNVLGIAIPLGVIIGLITVGLLFGLRNNQRFPAAMVVICLGFLAGILVGRPTVFEHLSFGWEIPVFSLPRVSDFYVALPILLLPQLPLTFANSIMATEDTATQYFGPQARKVHPRALFTSLGVVNLLAGFIGGIPVCHGSGGLTAHYRFGGRSGGASIIMGSIFIFAALMLGKAAPAFFNMIPLAVLGVMLVYIGVSHTFLIKDIVHSPWEVSLALGMALIALISGNLALAFVVGVPVCLLGKWLVDRRGHYASNNL